MDRVPWHVWRMVVAGMVKCLHAVSCWNILRGIEFTWKPHIWNIPDILRKRDPFEILMPEDCVCKLDTWAASRPHDKTNKMICTPSEDSDQTGQMPRLIWAYTWCTGHFVGFVIRRLTCVLEFSVLLGVAFTNFQLAGFLENIDMTLVKGDFFCDFGLFIYP